MKDRAGNNLAVGDDVLYLEPGRSNSWLSWGVVEGFTPKMVVVRDTKKPTNVFRRNPNSVVKPYKEQ